MKLNLEIEVDWMDDEMSLDETVKQQVIDGVVAKINKKVTEKIEKEVESKINSVVFEKISTLTENIFSDFMNREIALTDKYGDTVKVYPNMTALIKKRFDKFMTEQVDENGKVKTSNYGESYDRIVFIIDNQLTKFADKFTTDAVKKVSEEIKEHVKEGLTNKLGAELMKVLKVNDMLKLKS